MHRFTISFTLVVSGALVSTVCAAQELVALDASFLSQVVPPRVAVGQPYTVSLTFRNDGSESWTDDGNYFLQAMNPRNNDNWGVRRVDIPGGQTVDTGETVKIEFDILAPSGIGTVNFQWRMKKLRDANFGDLSPNIAVDVGAPELEAAFSLVSIPARLNEGEHKTIHLEVDNTGNTTWEDATGLMFQAAEPLNNNVWGVRRVDFTLSEPVQPGDTHRQSFEVVAPRKPGITPIRWVVKQFGGGLFSEVSEYKTIDVIRYINGGLRFAPDVYRNTGANVGKRLTRFYQDDGPPGWPTVREQVQEHLSQIREATELTHILLSLAAHDHFPWDNTVASSKFDNLVLLIEDAYQRGLGTMLEVGHACTVPASVMPQPSDPYGRKSLCGHSKGDTVVHGNGETTILPFDIPFVPTESNYIAEAKRFYLDLILGLKQELSKGAYDNLDFFVRGNHLTPFGAEIRLNYTDPYLQWTLDYLDALLPYLRENTDVSLSILTRFYTTFYVDDVDGYRHLDIIRDHPKIIDNVDYLAFTATSPLTPLNGGSNTLPEEIASRLQEYTYKVMLSDFGLGGGGPEAPPPTSAEKGARIASQFDLIVEHGLNAGFYIWSYQGTKNGLRAQGQFGSADEGWGPEPLAIINTWMTQ